MQVSKLLCFTLLLVSATPAVLQAQFQAVSTEELKMTSYSKDPGAAAVYLNIEDVTDDELHSRIFYTRIKVLTEKGKEVGKVEVPYQGPRDSDKDLATLQLPYQDTSMLLAQPTVEGGGKRVLSDFKARVIHPDGSVVPLEGKLADLLKEETTDRHTKRTVVNLPGVETGSVIEYRYVERYDGFYTSPHWDIQRNYPVRKAHYTFLPYKSFQLGAQNQVGSYLIDRHGVPLNFLLYWPKLPSGTQLRRDSVGRFFLDVTDVPAAPQGEWMPPRDSQLYRVRFYYRSDSDSKDFWTKETKRWSKEVDRLAEPTKAIYEAAASLIAPGDSEFEKAKKLYKAVQLLDNTDFERAAAGSSSNRVIADKRAEDTWKQKGGSRQDIALLYLALLRSAGITAYDMKVVNRDRSTFAQDYLYFGQLDDDILLVKVNGKEIALDPGEKMCPFEVVHWKHTGAAGVRQSPDGKPAATSPLQPYTANTLLRIGEINLDEHGAASGTFRFTMTGQEALHWRQAALENDESEVKKGFDAWTTSTVPTGMEVHIDRFEGLSNPEVNLVAIVSVKGSVATTSGTGIKLPCFFFEARSLEPFVDEQARAAAVDMHYGEQITDQVTYRWPAGMHTESDPKDQRFPWHESALFAVKSQAAAGQITIARSLARSFTFAKVDDYAA